MSSKAKGMLWGVAVAALGVLWGLKEANILTVNLFFNGWWTLFLIVPGVISLIKDKNKTGGFIITFIGAVLLVNCYYDLGQFKAYIMPGVVVLIGVIIIANSIKNKNAENKNGENSNSDFAGVETVQAKRNGGGYTAIFSGHNYEFTGDFNGGSFTAVFGGLKINLTKANIKPGCFIETFAAFGGIDLIVPSGYYVEVKSNSVFGGVGDKTNKSSATVENRIYLNSRNIFGGTDVKTGY